MKFVFSGTLLRFVDYQKEISVEASTVRNAVEGLVVSQPNLKNMLLDGEGKVRAAHRLFLNAEQLFAEDMDRPVSPSDCVEIVTAIAGG